MRDVKIARIPDIEIDPVTLDIIESALCISYKKI